MGGVRTLATIFLVLGWLSLAGSAIIIFLSASIFMAAFRNAQATMAVVGILAPLLFVCLTPFLSWGLLTGLCELHAQQERVQEQLDDLKRAGSPAAAGRV